MAQLALAPAAGHGARARDPAREVTFGGGTLCMLPPGGSPFVADRERGRRDGMYGDHVEVVKMTQATPLLRCGQSGACEAGDVPESSRHLDLDYSWIRYSDKPYVAYGTTGPRARDSVDLVAIAHGGREAIEERAGDHRHRQPQQPAGVGLRHGRGDVGLGRGESADRDDAVPAGRRDRARLGRRRAVAAGRRGALGRRHRAGHPARCRLLLRVVLLGRRHAQRRPVARHARVGARLARGRAARAPLRPAVPRRRRTDLGQRARRAGGDRVGHVALGHVPLGLRPRAARGRAGSRAA